MSVQETIQENNPIIRNVSKEVDNPTSSEVQKIITDLIDSMRHEDLVGMAAPQIGHNVRVFVTEVRKTKYRSEGLDELRIFINPEITWKSEGTDVGHEGCGSYKAAREFGPVERPKQIKITALDEKGKEFELDTEGFLARVIQHEVDHLDGKLFVDHVEDKSTMLQREEYLKIK